MQQRGVAASTYPTIDTYLKGDSSPRLDFVREAAELLGVRAAWLAFEDGGKTEEEEKARQNVQTGIGEPIRASTPGEMVAERFPMYGVLSPWAREVIREAVRRTAEAELRRGPHPPSEGIQREEHMRAAFHVGTVLSAALQYWPTGELSDESRASYAATVAQGLMHLAPREGA